MADRRPEKGTKSEGYRELVARAQHLTRDQFIAERHHPVLLQFGDVGILDSLGVNKTASGFQTVIPGVTSQSRAPRPLRIYELVKRAGANAFSHMITVGRAHNNDVVLPEAAVSKFHLSFTQREGVWYTTDSSSHGTWLNAIQLEKGVATRIDSGGMLTLAKVVVLKFLTPEDLFGYLVTGQVG